MSKMIGIRIPAESDLPERLKKIGIHLRKSHGELLEMWVSETENRKDLFGGNIFSPEDTRQASAGTPNESAPGGLAELRAQVEELTERVAALESRAPETADRTEGFAERFTEHTSPVGEPDAPPLREDRPENSAPVEPVEPDNSAETDTVTRILELSAKGLSTRKIAVRLNAEGIPTLAGGPSWNHGAVAKILKNTRKSEG